MKKWVRNYLLAGGLLFLFALFTVAVVTVDVQPIGPMNTSVGFATINEFVFEQLGQNLIWYHITDCRNRSRSCLAGMIRLPQPSAAGCSRPGPRQTAPERWSASPLSLPVFLGRIGFSKRITLLYPFWGTRITAATPFPLPEAA